MITKQIINAAGSVSFVGYENDEEAYQEMKRWNVNPEFAIQVDGELETPDGYYWRDGE